MNTVFARTAYTCVSVWALGTHQGSSSSLLSIPRFSIFGRYDFRRSAQREIDGFCIIRPFHCSGRSCVRIRFFSCSQFTLFYFPKRSWRHSLASLSTVNREHGAVSPSLATWEWKSFEPHSMHMRRAYMAKVYQRAVCGGRLARAKENKMEEAKPYSEFGLDLFSKWFPWHVARRHCWHQPWRGCHGFLCDFFRFLCLLCLRFIDFVNISEHERTNKRTKNPIKANEVRCISTMALCRLQIIESKWCNLFERNVSNVSISERHTCGRQ